MIEVDLGMRVVRAWLICTMSSFRESLCFMGRSFCLSTCGLDIRSSITLESSSSRSICFLLGIKFCMSGAGLFGSLLLDELEEGLYGGSSAGMISG